MAGGPVSAVLDFVVPAVFDLVDVIAPADRKGPLRIRDIDYDCRGRRIISVGWVSD